MGLLSKLLGWGPEDETDYNTEESLKRPAQADGEYTAYFRDRIEHEIQQSEITHINVNHKWIPIAEYKASRHGKMG
jgi:hypothetical protein